MTPDGPMDSAGQTARARKTGSRHGHSPKHAKRGGAAETLHVMVNQVLPDGSLQLTRLDATGRGLETVEVSALDILARGVAEGIPSDMAMMSAVRKDLAANIAGVPVAFTWNRERDNRGRMKGKIQGRKKQPKGIEPGQRDFNLEAYLRARYPQAFPAR